MKTFLKIFISFVVIFAIGAGFLGYLFYKQNPDLKNTLAQYLAKNDPHAMEEASKSFMESCSKTAKEKLQSAGLLTAEKESKIDKFCECATGKFKETFSSAEVMKIGLDKMVSQKANIPEDKLNKIVEACKVNL